MRKFWIGKFEAKDEYGRQFCQHDEESIVLNLFDIIGKGNKTLCDIGARIDLSNSLRLIRDFGFTGKLIDAKADACADIERNVPDHIEVICEKITIDNVNDYVGDVDFLSIDIDTNDWWVWAHIKSKPRIVCIEFNNHFTAENTGLQPRHEEVQPGQQGRL